MEQLKPEKTLKIYQLLKRDRKTMYITSAVTTATNNGISIGSGFFTSRNDAEMHRTMEVLKDGDKNEYYIFELEINNPVLEK